MSDRKNATLPPPRAKPGPAVGLLKPLPEPVVRLTRYLPSDDLAPFVDYYWVVRWDLGGDDRTSDQETLPHPCIHVVVQREASGVFGIVRGRFETRLRGRGRAASIRFRPGGFAPFWPRPLRELTGRVISLADAFGPDGSAYERDVLEGPDEDAHFVALAEVFLRKRRPEADEGLAIVTRATEAIASDRSIARVADLCTRLGVNVRTLQRLFGARVGVSPKWVICRARLQEAAARVVAGDDVDWSRVALDLGYFDQAHLVRAYRAIIGVAPTEHARRVRAG